MAVWKAQNPLDYQYVYHFGESESESDLVLIYTNGQWYGQQKSGTFSDDGRSWIFHYQNLSNIRVENGYFYSDQRNGHFVKYKAGTKTQQGLKLYSSEGETVEEIGLQSYPVTDYFAGENADASYIYLEDQLIAELSADELKVKRNEIFARYGYKFKAGGAMDTYFSTKPWYKPVFDNVDNFLTDLEKQNIARMLKAEQGARKFTEGK